MPEPPKNTALTAALARSRADYRAKWYAVDQELYELCSRRPSQDDYADVYVKVVIIGRVYAAGISRSSRADGDREAAVAQGIVRQAAEIDAALEEVSGSSVGCRLGVAAGLQLTPRALAKLLSEAGAGA